MHLLWYATAAATTVVFGAVVSFIMTSKKPMIQVWTEIKYNIYYNIIGVKYMLDDMIKKSQNRTELPLKTGRVALITGGARGIGSQVVKLLMKCDMHVIIGCRNVSAAEQLLEKIRDQKIKTGSLKAYKLDISSIKSVNEFATIVTQEYSKIHLLINNAGIMFGPYRKTVDGIESQFATNYVGHFLLTHLLLPSIKIAGDSEESSRIINVSSCAHVLGNIDDIIHSKEFYSAPQAYAMSKFAQVLFSNYTNTLFKEEGAHVQVHSVHPGIVNTELFDNTHVKNLFPWFPALIFKTPEQGAISIVHACVSATLEGKGGTYISNCQVTVPNEFADSTILQQKLFNYTKELLNIETFGEP